MTTLPPELAPFVAWPIAADGDDSRPYCERDDDAFHEERPGAYPDDYLAAQAVAIAINGIVVYAPRHNEPGAWSLAVYPDPRAPDTTSSASRQHFIDTGRYLRTGQYPI